MQIWRLHNVLLILLFLLIACYPSAKKPSPHIVDEVESAQAAPESQPVEDRTTEHPRLFLSQDEVPALQMMASTTHAEIWTPIEAYVISELGTSPPPSPPTDGQVGTLRTYGDQLIPFAFACVISNQTDICDLAKRYLLTYASWDRWSVEGERDLAMAHMVYGNAIAYDWLYDRLTANEQQLVRESLASWAHKLYEASVSDHVEPWKNWWRGAITQNHNHVNHSALGMAALALLGEDERVQVWLDRAVERMSRVSSLLNGIGDGSWHEGLGYQGYTLTMSLPFMWNLRRLTSMDIFPHAYLRNYPYWRLYNHLPETAQYIMAYGDFRWSWNERRPENILRFAANEYRMGHAEWLAQRLVAAREREKNVRATPWNTFEFFYYDPQIPARPPTDLPLARTFTDLEGVIWRTGWESEDIVFGLKTSAYGGRFAYDTFVDELYPWHPPCVETGCRLHFGHDHDDANSFYLYGNGQWLAPEVVDVQKVETRFHNTLLIDGEGQFRPSGDSENNAEAVVVSDGFLETTANAPSFNYVAADATHRYRQFSDLRDFTRHVLFLRPDRFLMVDNVEASQAHQYEWVAHFGESVTVKGNWIRGNAADEQILGVAVLAPETFTAEAGSDGQPFVRLRPIEPVQEVRFVTLLYPTDISAWKERPDATVVADNGEMLLAQIIQNDDSPQEDDVLLAYGALLEAATLGDYTFDGRVAVIQRRDGDIKKLFVYGGTVLRDEETETEWITGASSSGALEITYNASTVSVYSQWFDNLTIYAPEAQQLLVNGVPWSSYTRSGDYITIGVDTTLLPFVSYESYGQWPRN